MLRRVCKKDDINDNSMKAFRLENNDILIGRRNQKLFACSNSCPHRGASLSKGEFNDDNIVCYMHGYEYNIITGRLVTMKSWKKEEGWAEQSQEWRSSADLNMYPIVERDGYIYVEF